MARDACLLYERGRTLALSVVNARQVVPLGVGLRRGGTHAGHAASLVYVLAGPPSRYAWVGASSARRTWPTWLASFATGTERGPTAGRSGPRPSRNRSDPRTRRSGRTG